jgi:23S rRNA pseudouridine2605 synthase
VNGKTVTELGTKADPAHDRICVTGTPVQAAEKRVYLVLHKPKGYVTTTSDPQGRPTVMELLGEQAERLYPVGRLDYASEGLLLLTNDGELAQQLTRAASHIPKTYHVKISGRPSGQSLERLRNGVTIALEDGRRVKTAPAKVRLLEDAPNPWYEMVLIEGRNRQIRRMFHHVGHHVVKIKRVAMGSLRLDVAPGKFRELTEQEVAELKGLSA